MSFACVPRLPGWLMLVTGLAPLPSPSLPPVQVLGVTPVEVEVIGVLILLEGQ